MKNFILKHKKLRKLVIPLKNSLIMMIYSFFYRRAKLDNSLVAAESRNGADLAGNILRIMQELSKPDYGKIRFILCVTDSKREHAKQLVKRYGIKNVHYVRSDSARSLCLMSKAKYIINDSTYPRRYVKKEGQIYLNTWHGTPLKHMGRDTENELPTMGNVVRNLLQSDYILFPNEYIMSIMLKAYPLQGLYQGKFLLEGYPRNSAFFFEQDNKISKELGIEGKKLIVYMPTWRGKIDNRDIEKQQNALEAFFKELDSILTSDSIMYVKLHPLMRSEGGFTGFSRIRDFPSGYDCYDVLSRADVLITDYSSVLYDFACTEKKIVIFAYDEDDYTKSRGTYTPLSALPFPKVKTAKELANEIYSPKGYDDREFIKAYCPYESADSAAKICRHIFLGEELCKELKAPSGGKKNILLYAGNLSKNGVTSAFLNLLSHIDKEEYNYVLAFRQSSLRKSPNRLKLIPDEIQMIPMCTDLIATPAELYAEYLHTRKGKSTPVIERLIKRMYKREIARHFGGVAFSNVIQFCGYEQYVIEMFKYFDCNRIIYVHSDMVQEINKKGNQKLSVLKDAYGSYDKVALVNGDLIIPTSEISGRTDNLVVAENFQDFSGVTKKAQSEIAFEKDTDCTIFDPDGIEGILQSKGFKFITIGRFSAEKGHERLINAFEQFSTEYPDAKLIIIGGHGNMFTQTLKQARRSSVYKNIVIIRSMANPMPVLKRCDAFVMSSYYEGMPVVLFEAAILGLPLLATDVNGIRGFMNRYGGYLCEDSTEGLLSGMRDFADGKVNPVKIDFRKYNSDALTAYKSMLST